MCFLYISASLAVSEAVKCYWCSTVTDSACGDPYKANADHSWECSDIITGCSKSTLTVAGNTGIYIGLNELSSLLHTLSIKDTGLCTCTLLRLQILYIYVHDLGWGL